MGTTHVLLAVDRSGSMARLADDVRGGFNDFLDDLAGQDNAADYRLTVVMFNHGYDLLCPAASPLADVPRLDGGNYQPRGNTALLDAVGNLITTFEGDTQLGDDDRVMLVVQTDGRENSSNEFTAETVRAMIAEREGGGKWMSAYLGAGPDAWNGGAALGMRSVNTAHDGATTRSSYGAIATASAVYARGGTRAETFDPLTKVGEAGAR